MSDWTVEAAIEAAKKDPASYGRQVFELSNKRIALSKRVLKLEKALHEAHETLALMEMPAREDPEYSTAVQGIGDGVSYGAIMSTCEALWRQLLERNGNAGGEHVHGPARLTLDRTLQIVREALVK